MKYLLPVTLVIYASLTGLAQSISGKVVGDNNSTLDFVNVVLLKADSTYISGTVTDASGMFLFEKIQDVPEYVRLSSIGYTEKILDIPSTGNTDSKLI